MGVGVYRALEGRTGKGPRRPPVYSSVSGSRPHPTWEPPVSRDRGSRWRTRLPTEVSGWSRVERPHGSWTRERPGFRVVRVVEGRGVFGPLWGLPCLRPRESHEGGSGETTRTTGPPVSRLGRRGTERRHSVVAGDDTPRDRLSPSPAETGSGPDGPRSQEHHDTSLATRSSLLPRSTPARLRAREGTRLFRELCRGNRDRSDGETVLRKIKTGSRVGVQGLVFRSQHGSTRK